MTTRRTVDRITKEQARTAWQWEVHCNRRHLKDQPGFHVDEGVYVNQLRFHDSEGVLRGILRLHNEAMAGGKDATEYEWDDWEQEPGFLLIRVSPERLRRGIGTALLQEAYRRNWPIDLDKQTFSLAGAQLVRKFRESSRR
jgi:GNAT superfamily N-acetyltransferase